MHDNTVSIYIPEISPIIRKNMIICHHNQLVPNHDFDIMVGFFCKPWFQCLHANSVSVYNSDVTTMICDIITKLGDERLGGCYAPLPSASQYIILILSFVPHQQKACVFLYAAHIVKGNKPMVGRKTGLIDIGKNAVLTWVCSPWILISCDDVQ